MLFETGNFAQYLIGLLGSFRWKDILDIVIVALIIYKVCALMSGTRAVKLVIGLGMLLGLALFAYVLDLESLLWILEKCFSSLLIFVAIIFQPELRRILEEMGRGGMWHRRNNAKRAETTADELCRALVYCASRKIGALVVLQRETGLKDFCESAIYLNADITYELILSIFWVNNPLHDGAVIMDTNKILSAACYLPLTDEPELTRWYGTRHRAGIGITEVSDAVALIVSEERGEISLAQNGRLSTNLREPQLKRFLTLYFAGEGSESNEISEGIRERLTRIRTAPDRAKAVLEELGDIGTEFFGWFSSRMAIFAAALVIAFSLWGYHAGNRNEEIAKTFEVRLELRNPPAELRAFPLTETVSITLRGERRAVNALDTLDASVDLKGLEAGLHSLPVQFKTPLRMTAQVNPRDIEVRLVRMVDRELAVKAVPPENMPEDYTMTDAVVEPSTVIAHGREDQLDEISVIEVAPALADLQKGGTWKIPLRAPNGASISFTPAEVNVTAEYRQRETNRITLEVAAHDIVVTSQSAEQPQVPLLPDSQLTIGIAQQGIVAQTVPYPATEGIQAEITETSAPAPSASGLEVKAMSASADFADTPIAVRGAEDGAEWTVEPQTVTVHVEGEAKAIDGLTAEKLALAAYVDVTSIVTDSITLPVHLQYDKGISGIETIKADLATVKVRRVQKEQQGE